MNGVPLSRLLVEPGSVFLDSYWSERGQIEIDGRRLGERSDNAGVTLDARGLVVLPAFVDTHVHGIGPWRFWGHQSQGEYEHHITMAARELPKFGVAAFWPTSITESDGGFLALRAVDAVVKRADPSSASATVVGSHAEGPFLSKTCVGAHTFESLLDATPKAIAAFFDAAGESLSIVTTSPSVPGVEDLIRAVHAASARVQIGHDTPTASTFKLALDSGADGVTHLFNAMGGLHHRRNDFAAMALNSPSLYLELILNPGFVSTSWIELALTMASDRLIAVSDCIGDDPRLREVNGTKVIRDNEGLLRRESDGAVWSSTLPISSALGVLLQLGIGWGDITRVMSLNAIERHNLQMGTERGDYADMVCVTPEGRVDATIVRGQIAWCRNRSRLTESESGRT